MNSLIDSPTARRYLSSLLVSTALLGMLVRLSSRTSKIGAFHTIDILLGVCLGLGLKLSVLRTPSADTAPENSGELEDAGPERESGE